MNAAATIASPSQPATVTRAEILAWGTLLAFGVLIRVARIGDQPLDPDEAARALEALALWRDGRASYSGGPFISNLLSLLFGLATSGDGQARLVSAIAGGGLALAAWPLRPLLGRLESWCIALAFVLGPLFLAHSRQATPAVPTALALAVTATCAARFAVRQEPRWLMAAAVGVGIGLGTDPSYVVGLFGLVLATAIAEGDALSRPTWLPALRKEGPRAIGLAAVVAILVDSRLMMNPNGIQAGLIDPWWKWWQDVSRGGGLMAPAYLVLADGSLLLLALVGLLEFRRQARAIRLLGIWLVVSATFCMLMRQPDPRYLALALVPAALLAGLGIARLITTIRAHGTSRAWIVGTLLFIPLVTASVHLNTGLRPNAAPWTSTAIIAVAGLLVVGLLAINWLRPGELAAALAVFVFGFAGVWGITTSSRLLEAHGSARAHLVYRSVLTDEIHRVREAAHRWLRDDPSGTIAVDPAVRPLVAWSLRDVPTVKYDTTLLRQPVGRVLGESPSEAAAPRADRLVVGYAMDPATTDLRPSRLWRWMVGRESLVQVRPYAILLVEPAG